MSEHTPGPWFAEAARVFKSNGADVDDCDGPLSIADCDMDRRIDHDAVACANARLIAAAPELLAALLRLLVFYDNWDFEDRPDGPADDARAAIKKALGG